MTRELTSDLAGIIPPLTTPLTADGDVDTASLERLCGFLLDAGVDGLFVCGSSGEVALLSDAQRAKAIQVAAGAASGQVPVLGGIIDTGTARVVDHALAAQKAGADAVVATPPFYVAPHADEVIRHYRLIAAAVDVPVVAYDIPSATHSPLTRSVVAQLAGEKTVAALKDSSGDLDGFRAHLAANADTGLRVFTGSETMTDVALNLGAHGAVPGLANVDPHGYVRIRQAARAGDWATAASEQERLRRIFAIVDVADRSRIGLTAGALGAFKAAQYLRGVIDTPRCADPLLPLESSEIDAVRTILEREGVLG
ncbi:dihydrodipicolinate synthase family protein [Mycolicibacterium smegmatis]|uniref:dihydrodipicolinate synthase family protein n=1 Tax=Mycolicibacterium smegmatis TaxID=1772 RepID=UPI001EFAAB0C|nr:dihydrodipicolinate synthase family protein [Mycolicibacterium smegmatis]ULN36149.1 dihydrodipicolinate synthase family protein [Mycolicibacterium smegmatis]